MDAAILNNKQRNAAVAFQPSLVRLDHEGSFIDALKLPLNSSSERPLLAKADPLQLPIRPWLPPSPPSSTSAFCSYELGGTFFRSCFENTRRTCLSTRHAVYALTIAPVQTALLFICPQQTPGCGSVQEKLRGCSDAAEMELVVVQESARRYSVLP